MPHTSLLARICRFIGSWLRPRIDVEAVRVLRLQPGDCVVLSTSAALAIRQVDQIRSAVEPLLKATGARAVFLSRGFDLAVYQPPEPNARGAEHGEDRPDHDLHEDVVPVLLKPTHGGVERAP
jgi:hypothetical protein